MDIYSENIMDHYKDPRNFGSLEDCDIEYSDSNPLCGDKIKIEIKIKDNRIHEMKYECEGCAISRASSSIISEELKGMELEKVLKLNADFVLNLLGIKLNSVRLKCALLSLRAVQKSIVKYLGEKNA
ncbi:MAG: iron-sulfur cluster assembly scaffold protein [Patescibacteria group bacterium]